MSLYDTMNDVDARHLTKGVALSMSGVTKRFASGTVALSDVDFDTPKVSSSQSSGRRAAESPPCCGWPPASNAPPRAASHWPRMRSGSSSRTRRCSRGDPCGPTSNCAPRSPASPPRNAVHVPRPPSTPSGSPASNPHPRHPDLRYDARFTEYVGQISDTLRGA